MADKLPAEITSALLPMFRALFGGDKREGQTPAKPLVLHDLDLEQLIQLNITKLSDTSKLFLRIHHDG